MTAKYGIFVNAKAIVAQFCICGAEGVTVRYTGSKERDTVTFGSVRAFMTKPAEYIRRPSRHDMKECESIKDIAQHDKRKLMTKVMAIAS